jgi:transcriptional regulator with GAF, ATPase, and Fis domain
MADAASEIPKEDAAELAQLRRLHELDALFPTLTTVLDLREVFEKVSEIAKRALPHDALGVLLIEEGDPEWTSLYATAGAFPPGPPLRARLGLELVSRSWDHLIVPDIANAPESAWFTPEIREWARGFGLHSHLRVPIKLDGRVAGTVAFISRLRDAYTVADVVVANRVRDLLVLALSHHRMAQARARLAAERELSARAEARAKTLSDQLAAAGGYTRIVGASEAWKAVVAQGAKVAPTDTTVLVTGESGTGKECVARLIHGASRRAAGPFVAINCAALPENLLESELFGFEKGAFSGAVQAKPGRIEQATGGTLFLDEIGEMSLVVQAKLLRFLEQREFQRLGGAKTLKADVRIVAGTNRDLKSASAQGDFREDLYYRVSVFEIRTPPLRERPDDILPLAESFLADFGRSLGRPAAGLAPVARVRLLGYRWPGNVRELRNVLERASILCENGLITSEHLAIPESAPAGRVKAPGAAAAAKGARPKGDADLGAIERATIERVLEETRFNKSRAAKRLGITRGQLYIRLKKYGLDAGDENAAGAE